jgi:hypothetical protein
MDFKLEHEVDRGPLVRWAANQAMNMSSWLAKVSSPYADMYTAVWDDYEDEENLSVPHNQMGLFEDLETLPQFENIDKGLL